MNEKGIIRPVDKLGRIVIPKELRRMLDVKNDIDSFEITVSGDSLVLKKHNPRCIFCGNEEECIEYSGHLVCKGCIENLLNLVYKREILE